MALDDLNRRSWCRWTLLSRATCSPSRTTCSCTTTPSTAAGPRAASTLRKVSFGQSRLWYFVNGTDEFSVCWSMLAVDNRQTCHHPLQASWIMRIRYHRLGRLSSNWVALNQLNKLLVNFQQPCYVCAYHFLVSDLHCILNTICSRDPQFNFGTCLWVVFSGSEPLLAACARRLKFTLANWKPDLSRVVAKWDRGWEWGWRWEGSMQQQKWIARRAQFGGTNCA